MDFNKKSLTTTRLLCIVGLLTLSVEAQYKLSIDVRPQSVKEGDTLIVKCKVNKTSSKADEVEIVWVRRMVGERDLDASGRLESKEIEIGRNATVLEDFQKSGKYKAKQEFQDYYQIYSLVISGWVSNTTVAIIAVRRHVTHSANLQASFIFYSVNMNMNSKIDLKSTDSGEVGCRLLNNHIEIFKPVVVHKLPKKISLMSKNLGNDQATSYQDKERVEFTELEKRNFQCYIREVYPEPRVRILLGKEDITDRFNKSLRLTRTVSDEGIVSIGELSALHYDVIMTSYGLEFTYEFDNNSISCLADFPGSGFSTSSATAHVMLKGYTPKFICNHDYHVPLHHSNFQIQCKVLGHPRASSARVHWQRHTSGNMSVSAGEKHGSYEAQLEESQKDDVRARMFTFRIDHIFPQHFRQYQLEATNAMGTSTFEVNLHQIGKTRFIESGASVNLPIHLSLTWCSSVALILLR